MELKFEDFKKYGYAIRDCIVEKLGCTNERANGIMINLTPTEGAFISKAWVTGIPAEEMADDYIQRYNKLTNQEQFID